MVAIRWCKSQKRGIELVEPNDNLFDEYIRTSEESLDILRSIRGKSKVWVATTKYYTEYFAVYSLLMKIGVKCEIHDCTIALCTLLEEMKIIPPGYSKILEEDKQLRIDNQYYLKNRDVPLDYDKILEFVATIKNVGIKLTNAEIKKIRERISKV
ncbi:MAG: hypothetical protein AABX63_00590 [Nanoarchaeota archaeon]